MGFAGVVRPGGGSLGPEAAHGSAAHFVCDRTASAHDPERGVTLLAHGRVLPGAGGDERRPLTTEELLARHRAVGEDFMDRLRGSFALAIWDERARRLTLVRDVLGRVNLVWCATEGGVAFATDVRGLHGLPGVERALDLGRLAVFFHGVAQLDEEHTVWRGVRRVPARGRLIADADGTRVDRWFDWASVATRRDVSDDEWVERYRSTFRRAIRRGHEEGEPVGALLSGGLDSSSIVVELAAARRAAGEGPLETFSARFPRTPSSDEGHFARAVVATGHVRSTEVDVDALEPLGAPVLAHVAARDEPSYGANLFVNLALTRAAAERGVHVLFDGVDGDSVLGYGLERLVELARAGRLPTLVRELRLAAPRLSTTAGALFRGEVLAPLRSRAIGLLPDGLLRSRRRPRVARALAPFQPELVEAEGLVERVTALGHRPADLSCRASLLTGLESAFHGMILEFLGRVLAEAGVRGAFPYFDRDLVELSLALPADQRLRNGWTRSIQRRAGERLPDEVRWRPWKHLLSRAFADALLAHHRDLVPRLDDPNLPIWQLLEPRRVRALRDRLLERGRADDAFFIGKTLALACWLDPNSLV